MALAYKGGRFQLCAYDSFADALEFYHLEAQGKDFGLSDRGYTRSWSKIMAELDKCLLLCANCHREVYSGLQLLRETADEKSGEFREACPSFNWKNGNPEPSPEDFMFGEGAETRASARTPDIIRGKRPTPYRQVTGAGEEIVQAQKKFWGPCNH